MSKSTISAGCKLAKPVLSVDSRQAHRRVMGLYRAYYRYIPYIIKHHNIPKNECDVKWKLREYFYKNACVTDIRIIDILVMKGYMNLKEITHQWQQKGVILSHWHPTREQKRTDFVGKFLNGDD